MMMNPDVDHKVIHELREDLTGYRKANVIKKKYYDAKVPTEDLNISVPQHLRAIRQACGYCNITLQSLTNRISFEGWYETDSFGLQRIYEDNDLGATAGQVHLDMLLYGTSFVVVSAGDVSDGEPEVMITPESPMNVAVKYNRRAKRIEKAIIVIDGDEDGEEYGTYLTREATIPFTLKDGKVYEEEGGFFHGLGRVPVVMFTNRPENNRVSGHSEITEPMMSLTQSIMRTMLEMEIAREFFASPQRYILGATEEMFQGKDGENTSKLSVLLNKVLILSDNETEGATGEAVMNRVQVGQFTANDPSTFTKLLDQYGKMFSAMSATPQEHLGLTTVNPVGGDAQRAADARQIDRVNQIIRISLKAKWNEVGKLAVLTRDGELPEEFKPLAHFRDLSTPARSAAADEVLKLISGRVLQPSSEIVKNRIDLTPEERKIMETENTMAGAQDILTLLAGDAAPTQEAAPVEEEKVA